MIFDRFYIGIIIDIIDEVSSIINSSDFLDFLRTSTRKNLRGN